MAIFDILAQGQPTRSYSSGQIIYLQGTYPDQFYYLLFGTVRSFISSPSGEERVLTIHRPGDLMGEASFFDECPRVTSAMALEECRVVTIDRNRLDSIFAQHPEMAMPMLQYLARTVRMLSDHVEASSLPARQRVARYLLAMPGKSGVPLFCTHEGIGQAVGLSRVTVSRVLGELSAQGMVELGYRTIIILQRGMLYHLAYNA